MRHIFFRSILTLVWLAAAIFSIFSGNIPWAVFYLIIGGACLGSAYRMWKTKKDKRGGN